MRSITGYILVVLCVVACKKPYKPDFQKSSLSKKGMIVSANHHATEAGLFIMREGGNAVDAAIAMHFVLAVCYPSAGNLGGGGFMLYRNASNKVTALDFRETAPALSHQNMFLDNNEHPVFDALSIGVPGSIAGLWEMHQKLSSNLEWSFLLQPAIKLAKEGFQLSYTEAQKINSVKDQIKKHNDQRCPFIKKDLWEAGDILIQKELASTLELIANGGPSVFYKGALAESMILTIVNKGGILSMKDLLVYKPIWRELKPLTFHQFEIYSMPPPSAGGLTLLQIARMTENYSLEKDRIHSPYNIHLISEASRSAFDDCAQWLGDPNFIKIPEKMALSHEYLTGKMIDYNPEKVRNFTQQAIHISKDSEEGTHFSVVDNEGKCVAISTGLNSNYGSKIWIPAFGCFMNNQMQNFKTEIHQTNQMDSSRENPNNIESRKRMASFMAPTIITKGGELFLTLGSSGGSEGITSSLQVLLQVLVLEQNLSNAISADRFHCQGNTAELILEESLWKNSLILELKSKGHRLKIIKQLGAINAIRLFDNGMLEGAGDPRDESHARGL
jgi:gamma-glutamyltranspeptidase / glutathione hydrolase